MPWGTDRATPGTARWQLSGPSEATAREACAELNRRFAAAGLELVVEIGTQGSQGVEILVRSSGSSPSGTGQERAVPVRAEPAETPDRVADRIEQELWLRPRAPAPRPSRDPIVGRWCDPL